MKTIWLPLLAILGLVAAGIYFVVQPTFHDKVVPSVLRVGILPDEDVETLHLRYDPLLKHLSAETGVDFRLVLPSDYGELVRLFNDHEVDLAHFGGLTFIQAHISSHAQPLVMRDVDTRFTSWFLVKDRDPADVLADFKGKVFAFGSRLSTSGHLMPRHFMRTEKQIIPEEYFTEVRYSGAHDKTAYLVRNGEVDLGVANSEIIKNMFRDGRLKANDLRVLWETPPYPDYVWAVHDHFDEGFKTRLRDAFLALDATDAVHGKILAGMGAKAFFPAGVSEFLPLKGAAETLGLLK
ncbi:MAG: phosphate/phosphite/phosphonate ABC transporter substrate-binding protein [Gammaproteobacteria bacterium]|nr:phosphate/phosphite/phosphonate ABC transporter substrate-binding protein [Gammaproteobacteria bacterium]